MKNRGSRSLLGWDDFRLHEMGHFRTRGMEVKREIEEERRANERKPFISAALRELAFTSVRDVMGRKLYRNEPFTLEDWPALGPLTGRERTEVIAEARHILGLGDPRPRATA